MLEPESFIPPNLGNIAINAGSTHGTQVASMAVGVHLGVASKARLVGVKTTNARNLDTWDSFFEIWTWLLHDVRTKGLAGKAVINFSYGRLLAVTTKGSKLTFLIEEYQWYYQIRANLHVDYQVLGIPQPEESDGYLPVLRDCWAAGIVTVFAAANGEGMSMGELSLQRFTAPENPMIVVGSVNKQGFKSRFNRHPGPATNARGRDLACIGELTLYALGEDVRTIDPDGPGNSIYSPESGISMAAPQIAGLAAYILTLPGLEWNQATVAMEIKRYLIRQKRNMQHLDGLDIAYNGIWGSPCPPTASTTRRRALSMTGILDYLMSIFKRQDRKDDTIIIFKNGHLTDPKYSDEVSLICP